MTAPAEQAIEQDLARDDTPHVFCVHCYPTAPRPRARALCGTIARQRGGRGYLPGMCLVCVDLWDTWTACDQCGQVSH